ncbi:MAG: 6-hydroxymethylpterin diphosphokinase MptE-like protein [Thermoplasmata archaeon]
MQWSDVEYEEWARIYQQIQDDFGFPFSREQDSAEALRAQLSPRARHGIQPAIARRLEGHDVIVVGLAPGAGAPPVWRLSPTSHPRSLVAADGAAAICLDAGLVPDIVVTDLDGPVPSEVLANARGSIAVIHAHGDNQPAIERWTSEFSGEVQGSWAGPPSPDLLNVGGFTDGDRAAFLAEHFGALRVVLWGFDFTHPSEDEIGKDVERKRKKLKWAENLLTFLAQRAPGRLFWWGRDGVVRPFPVGQGTAATQ